MKSKQKDVINHAKALCDSLGENERDWIKLVFKLTGKAFHETLTTCPHAGCKHKKFSRSGQNGGGLRCNRCKKTVTQKPFKGTVFEEKRIDAKCFGFVVCLRSLSQGILTFQEVAEAVGIAKADTVAPIIHKVDKALNVRGRGKDKKLLKKKRGTRLRNALDSGDNEIALRIIRKIMRVILKKSVDASLAP